MNRRAYLERVLWLGGGMLLPAGVVAILGQDGSGSKTNLPGFHGQIMGTAYSVKLGSDLLSRNALQELFHGSHRVLQKVDDAMSTWKPGSEISRFNQTTHNDWQKFSPSSFAVVRSAMSMSHLSSGAFDVSVGPLVDLWGFGAGSLKQSGLGTGKPDSSSISAKREEVGYQHIELDKRSLSVRKLKAVTEIDLSSIAKGYAVDQLAEYLDQSGIESYLVEVGGELRSRGHKPDASNWKVAIERPQVGSADVFRIVELNNMAIATSGDYRHFFTYGAQRYSHSIDPRTGFPVDHGLASVSVIAANAMLADALSTALIIMGPAEAMTLAESQSIAAHFVLRSETGFLSEQYTTGFTTHIA